MRATGIVRRVDELGRIVIPKEIRRTLRMREGAPLEIYTDNDGSIVLKKYSQMGELKDFSKEAADSIFSVIEQNVIITDKDEVIASSGQFKNDYIKKPISLEVEKLIANRKATLLNKKEKATIDKIIKNDINEYVAQVIVPINVGGDTVGAIIIFSKEPLAVFGNTEVKVASSMANFLAKQME